MSKEIERIKEVYSDRQVQGKIDYNPFLPANYYLINSREKMLLQLLYQSFGTNMRNLQFLDVGFGSGFDMLTLIKNGLDINHAHGTEILEDRFKRVKQILPEADLKLTSGFSLPFESETMDFIIQSTVFSSISDKNSRKELAADMYRVLKKNGKIFFYDMKIPNPWNKNITKMDRKEIKDLFPEAKLSFHSVTLNPVLVRRIANQSIILCELLEKIPLLCSHFYTVIEKS